MIHFTYECLTNIIEIFWKFMEKQEFLSQTRLFSNVVSLMVKDLFNVYKVYQCIAFEVMGRFHKMTPDQAQRSFVLFQNFVTLTNVLEQKMPSIMSKFVVNLSQPKYYRVSPQQLYNLKYQLEHH
jgi:hypothetical protein